MAVSISGGCTRTRAKTSVAETRTLLIRGFEVNCLIGVHLHEQRRVQRVIVDVELEVKPTRHDDDFRKVVSYEDVVDAIRKLTNDGHMHLVETLAERIASHCLGIDDAIAVSVTVLKPDVLPGSAALGVRIHRNR